jgi:hypothetical protein
LPTRALPLAPDALHRPVETLATGGEYSATIVAGTLAEVAVDGRERSAAGQGGADCVYIPTGPEVYNTALVWPTARCWGG